MALLKVLVFAAFKVLHNLVFVQKSFFLQITADVSKISKSTQANIVFILNVPSGTVGVFASICLVFEIKKCC